MLPSGSEVSSAVAEAFTAGRNFRDRLASLGGVIRLRAPFLAVLGKGLGEDPPAMEPYREGPVLPFYLARLGFPALSFPVDPQSWLESLEDFPPLAAARGNQPVIPDSDAESSTAREASSSKEVK